MKKRILIFGFLFLIISLGAMGDISMDMKSMDKEYQELLEKEQEKVEEFKMEKMKLEEELAILEERMSNKSNVLEKLEKNSEIRWHRDEYKKLLKKYKKFYEKTEKLIEEKKIKISELSRLLEIMK